MTDTNDSAQQFSFKAETKQLLNILAHSLYKDREVFLRELLSNASDALNRLRFEMVTNRNVLDSNAELNIHIKADKDVRMLTIQDTGIGLTRDEMIENLGTIAQSGARKFLDATKDQKVDFAQVIGQFGVGFKSSFRIADEVFVQSWEGDSRFAFRLAISTEDRPASWPDETTQRRVVQQLEAVGIRIAAHALSIADPVYSKVSDSRKLI
jgi:HSP90 family molecular chaperone